MKDHHMMHGLKTQPPPLDSVSPLAKHQKFSTPLRTAHLRSLSALLLAISLSHAPQIGWHRTSLEASLAIAQSIPNESANPRLSIAQSLMDAGFPEESLALYEQELQHFQYQGDRSKAAETSRRLAATLVAKGQLFRALPYYQRALEIYKAPGQSQGDRVAQHRIISEIANDKGTVYLALDQPDLAFQSFQTALMSDSTSENAGSQAETLVKLGTLYRTTGQIDQALTLYQQAKASYLSLDQSSIEIPQILNRIGLIYQGRQQFELALAAYEEARQLIRTPKNDAQFSTLVLTLDNLSSLYQLQGNPQRADALTNQSEKVLAKASRNQAIGTKTSREADILEAIGQFYLVDQQLEYAERYFDRVVVLARRSENAGYPEINLLDRITLAYAEQGKLEACIPYLQRTTEVFEEMGLSENIASSLSGLADLYQTVGQFDRALNTYQKALTEHQETQQKSGQQTLNIAHIFKKIGRIYEAKAELESAAQAYQNALTYYKTSENQIGQILVLETLAQIFRKGGQIGQSQQYLQQAQALRSQEQSISPK